MKKINVFLKKGLVLEELLVAFLLTVAMMYFFGETLSRQYLMAFLVFVALFVLIKKGVEAFDKRRIKFALVFAIPLGVAMAFGRGLDIKMIEFPSFNILMIPLAIALTIIIVLMSLCVLSFMDGRAIAFEAKARLSKKR